MSQFLRYLRGWIGVVGFVAFGNTVQCFRGHDFLSNKLYTGSPHQVNALMARVFGVWTCLSAVLRILCAYDFDNRSLYNLTFFSFVLAFAHFVVECFIYKTAPITVGVLAPLLISGISIVAMLVGYRCQTRTFDEGNQVKSTSEIPFKYKKHKS